MERREQEGLPVPTFDEYVKGKGIEPKPVPELIDREVYDAWLELRSDAPPAFGGATRIPYTAIIRWLNEEQVPAQHRAYLRTAIRTLDERAVAYRNEQAERKDKQQEQAVKQPAKMGRK